MNNNNNNSSVPITMNVSDEYPVPPAGCVREASLPFLPWDNPDNIVHKRVDTWISLVTSGVCVPALYVICLGTNVINMAVFRSHGLRERINACLFTLSLVDLMSSTVVFFICCDRVYMFVLGRGWSLGPVARFVTDNYLIGLLGFTTSSQLVYSFVAVERCLCVTRPLLVKRFMSTKATVCMLWSLVFVITGMTAFVLGIPYGLICVLDPTDHSPYYMFYPREMYYRMKGVIDLLHSTLMGFALSGFCLCCVVTCTVVTAVKLRQLTRWRKSVSSASDSVSSRDVAIARVIVGTSVLFTVCLIPSLIKYTGLVFVPDIVLGQRYDNLGWVFKRFYELCTAVNNSFNFFVYYTFGSRFRETVHSFFPACFRRGRNPPDKREMTTRSRVSDDDETTKSVSRNRK